MTSYNGYSAAQRSKAQRWLNEQWRSGTLPRPCKCSVCGQARGPIDAHAEDYSEPFGPHVQEHHLCFLCHMMVHCRFRNPNAWAAYLAMLRSGNEFKPFYTRDFGRVKSFLNGGPLPYTRGPARESLGLFDQLTA